MHSWKKSLGTALPLMLLSLGACGESTEGLPPPNATCDDSATSQLVANKLTLPSMTQSYAADLDGDGSTDNRFQRLFTGLEAAGFGTQKMIDNMVTYGRGTTLVQVRGSGQTNGCSTSVSMQPASQPSAPPRFDGQDRFMPRPGTSPVALTGTVSNGRMGTTSPRNLQPSQVTPLKLSVPLVEGVTVPLELYGVQLEGSFSDSGALEGEMRAVLRKHDIDDQLIPAMAQALTAKVKKDPTGWVAQAIVPFFEDSDYATSRAKCESDPARCCAMNPTTCEISAAELRENTALMQNLEPDVQMFQNGAWQPTPGGSAKDSLSIGFGISAVKASF